MAEAVSNFLFMTDEGCHSPHDFKTMAVTKENVVKNEAVKTV